MEEIDPVPHGRDAMGTNQRGVGIYDRPESNKAKMAAVIAALAILALAIAMFLLMRRA